MRVPSWRGQPGKLLSYFAAQTMPQKDLKRLDNAPGLHTQLAALERGGRREIPVVGSGQGDVLPSQRREVGELLLRNVLAPTTELLYRCRKMCRVPEGYYRRKQCQSTGTVHLIFVRAVPSMPDRPTLDYWQLFTDRTELYKKVFENEDVIIFGPEVPADGAG